MQANFLPAAGSGGALLRRLDPRTKLALFLASFVIAILPPRPAVAGMVAGMVLFHLALALE
jgi:energy-coupling factor transporter transmembrane protein EcfT